MKENLVSIALRFQVAERMAEEDGRTLVSLRKEANEARLNELSAKKQAAEATEIILALRIEVSSLKRAMKEMQADKSFRGTGSSAGGGGTGQDGGAKIFAQADQEVEDMFARSARAHILPNTGGDMKQLTSFQQWKIQKFLYSPDTPAASENHDRHTVDMMAEAYTKESLLAMRVTKSRVGKLRSSSSASSLKEGGLGSGPGGSGWRTADESPSKEKLPPMVFTASMSPVRPGGKARELTSAAAMAYTSGLGSTQRPPSPLLSKSLPSSAAAMSGTRKSAGV